MKRVIFATVAFCLIDAVLAIPNITINKGSVADTVQVKSGNFSYLKAAFRRHSPKQKAYFAMLYALPPIRCILPSISRIVSLAERSEASSPVISKSSSKV